MTGYLSLELRRAFRDRRYMSLVVLWPVAAYLLFSTIFGGNADRAEGLPPHIEIMVAMATFGAIGAVLLATGPRMAVDRQLGWIRQLRLTPLAPSRMLTVRVVAALLLTLPAICLTFAVAAIAKGVSLPLWEWVAMVGILLVGCLPFAAIGVIIGSVSRGDGAAGITMVAYIVFALLGGLWMPLKIMPPQMRSIAHLLPSNRLAELGWQVAGGRAPHLTSVAVLFVWFALAASVAAVLSRRVSVRSI